MDVEERKKVRKEGRKKRGKKIDEKGAMTKYNYKCGKEHRLRSTSKESKTKNKKLIKLKKSKQT